MIWGYKGYVRNNGKQNGNYDIGISGYILGLCKERWKIKRKLLQYYKYNQSHVLLRQSNNDLCMRRTIKYSNQGMLDVGKRGVSCD